MRRPPAGAVPVDAGTAPSSRPPAPGRDDPPAHRPRPGRTATAGRGHAFAASAVHAAAPVIPAPPIEPGPVPRRDDEQGATERDPRADTARVTAPPAPETPPSTPNPIDTAQPPDPPMDARALARTPAGAASTQGGFMAGLARHQAGRIDRELRTGKPGVPAEADTPMARIQRGLESAHIDRSLTLQSDTYTSPDGVVIYRFRQGNRFRCRRAGGVGMPLAGMPGTGAITAGGAGAAGATDCPTGVVWNQDPRSALLRASVLPTSPACRRPRRHRLPRRRPVVPARGTARPSFPTRPRPGNAGAHTPAAPWTGRSASSR